MKILISILAILMIGQNLLAQENFYIKNASGKYDLSIRVTEDNGEEKSDSYINGAADISIYLKNYKKPFQILQVPNMILSKENTAFNSKINNKSRQLYAETYSVVFEDFNFDGYEDLAVWNGNNGGYNGPSYSIYLYRSGKFYLNGKLSELTEGAYLGLFFTEPKKKQLITFSKSGCCYHETEKYKLIRNSPFLIEKEIDYLKGDDRFLETRKLIKGRWVKRTKKLKKEA